MDTLLFAFNETCNETLNIMVSPIIRFPCQSESIHRQLVFLKCLMMANMENKHRIGELIRSLRIHLSTCFIGLVTIMMALSSELVEKAFPLMLFCFSCNTQNLFAFKSQLRHGISFMFNVMCCIEVLRFEFVFDVYFVLCYLSIVMYSLHEKKHEDGTNRTCMDRSAMLLVFMIEVGLFYFSDVVDYKFTLVINAAFTLYEVYAGDRKVLFVAAMYNFLAILILSATLLEIDIDAVFDYFVIYSVRVGLIQYWKNLIQYWDDLIQYWDIVSVSLCKFLFL